MMINQSFELFIKHGSTYWLDSTKCYYEKNCNFFFRYLEDRYETSVQLIDLEDLPPDILNDYIIWLRNKDRFSGHPLHQLMNVSGSIKSNTVNTYMRAIKAYFNYLFDTGVTRIKYAANLKMPKSDDDQMIPLMASEVAVIDSIFDRTIVNDLRNLCILHLMLDAGLRSVEVRQLRPSDILFHNSTLLVNRGKGNKSRAVILCPALAGLLQDYIKIFRPSGFLFRKVRKNEAINETVIKSLFQRVIRNTGIYRIHPHLLRHTFATSYIMGGGNLESLRILLGHFDYSVTRRYLHLAAQNQILGSEIYQLDRLCTPFSVNRIIIQDVVDTLDVVKQGAAGEQLDANHGLYDITAGLRLAVFRYIGKPKAEKLQGFGDRVPKVLGNKTICEKYHYLAVSHTPIPDWHRPFLGYFPDRKVYNLADGIIGWQDSLGFCKLA